MSQKKIKSKQPKPEAQKPVKVSWLLRLVRGIRARGHLMVKNPFRKVRGLDPLKGHYNPCVTCWKFSCDDKCLVHVLGEFAYVLRSNPELSQQFDKHYMAVKYAGDRAARRQFSKDASKKEKNRKKTSLKSVN